ncbi:Cation/H+ exchanger [Fennellomyces sp. T-0311]|nr:Cation/H+ exchanger [Fennellomyces sp. T-0311]
MLSSLDLTLLVLAIFSLIIIIFSQFIRDKLYLSEAFFAVLFGIAIGPHCLNMVNVDTWGTQETITMEFSRVVIAIQVMVTGVTLPSRFIYKHFKSLIIMLVPVMLAMWFVSGSIVCLMVPGLDFIGSLMIASCFTPTDPVLSSSIVQGRYAEKYVRSELRDMIAAESAANDGLGYPFLFIAVYRMQFPTSEAVRVWFVSIILQEIVLSIVLGSLVGWLARGVSKWCFKRNLLELEALHFYPLALSFLLLGGLAFMKSDDLLACFMAGCTLSWDPWFQNETSSHGSFLQVLDILLNIGIFSYIGVTMPLQAFVELSLWRLVLLAALVLLFRRVPIVLGLYKASPLISNWREALFAGWFGPMGVGAIFYCATARESYTTDDRTRSSLIPVVYFVVLSSVVVHGLSIPLIVLFHYIKERGSAPKLEMLRTVTGLSEATTAIDMGEQQPTRTIDSRK